MTGKPITEPSDLTAKSPMWSVDRFWMLLGIALTLYILATTLMVIRSEYTPIPRSDQWDEWKLFLATKSYSSFFFSQHNEHRIAFARISVSYTHLTLPTIYSV